LFEHAQRPPALAVRESRKDENPSQLFSDDLNSVDTADGSSIPSWHHAAMRHGVLDQ
jgi:hypothetical protein